MRHAKKILFITFATLLLSCSSTLQTAIKTNNINEATKLLETRKPTFSNLACAVNAGNEELIQLIIDKGMTITPKNSNALLLKAIETGYPNVVEILIKNGGDVNQQNILGVFPLLEAVKAGNLEIIEVLLEYGADVNQPSKGRGFDPRSLSDFNTYRK